MKKKDLNLITPYIFILPGFILFICFFFYPIILTFYYSITNWDGFHPVVKIIGFDNYKLLFTEDPKFWVSIKNNLKFIVVWVFIANGLALLLAMTFNRIKGKNIYRAVFFMPVVISATAAGYIWTFIFDPSSGTFSIILKALNFPIINWLGDPKVAIFSILLADVWKNVGYNMVLFIAGLQTIPADVYEASLIDGARGWSRFKFITFPLLASTTRMVTILSVIGCLKTFDMVYVMTGGGPGYSTEVIATRIFNEAFSNNFFIGYASAEAVVLFIVILAVSLLQLYLSRKKEVTY